MNDICFRTFQADISAIDLPAKFTFPFYYTPHELSLIATKELQGFIIKQQSNWSHNFGFDTNKEGDASGKMFGVLVVQDSDGTLGYLAAFSGMLNGTMDVEGFVPAAYDDSFDVDHFHKEFDRFNQLTNKISNLKNDESYLEDLATLRTQQEKHQQLLQQQLEKHQRQRKERKAYRNSIKNELSEAKWNELLNHHHQLQLNEKFLLREYEIYLNQKVEALDKRVQEIKQTIESLETERKQLSLQHQDWIFQHYNLLNKEGSVKNVVHIFQEKELGIPPSSTGDCAAPKLLQYAYKNSYTPIAMAEFWWGESSKSNIRKHKQFYPACRSKCEPILEHMLKGLNVEPNPMLINPATDKKISIIYEDEAIAIINKPAEFLSVPGKTIKDSVLTRLEKRYPDATGPLLVHRLDMSTSGILVMAKTKKDHQKIQEQFIKKTVHKKYIALLDGLVKEDEGEINLPLRVDLDNRPCQLVCYDHGKKAKTVYKVLERSENHTRVEFIPITGRTHQLRVHAAHALGLNAPILGDDLYGTKNERLHLHATYIKFNHPRSGRSISFDIPTEF